jgi:transposase
MTQPAEELRPRDGEILRLLQAANPGIRTAYDLAQQFRRLVRERDADDLERWVDRARASDLQELRGFPTHLQLDRPAVNAALILPWSNEHVA